MIRVEQRRDELMVLKGRVLVVDDNETVRAMLRAGLEAMGWLVSLSISGRGVLAQMNEHRVDVVLLDVVMDDQEGIETLMEIKAASPTLPVVMVSSHEQYLVMAESFGADATCAKPLDVTELDTIMSTLISAAAAH